jgi:uncharacterized protein (UPF0332 family)
MTIDTADLLKKAKESLAAAELLVSRNYHAFAVSRAYYAMFYVAEACLASIGQSYSSHGATQAAYGREFAKDGKLDPKFHRWLIDAQDIRNIGDYGVGVDVSAEQAREVCSWAKEFIASAEKHLS